MTNFIVADRTSGVLLPLSIEEWLNEDHLARFVVEVIDQLYLSHLTARYSGRLFMRFGLLAIVAQEGRASDRFFIVHLSSGAFHRGIVGSL